MSRGPAGPALSQRNPVRRLALARLN